MCCNHICTKLSLIQHRLQCRFIPGPPPSAHSFHPRTHITRTHATHIKCLLVHYIPTPYLCWAQVGDVSVALHCTSVCGWCECADGRDPVWIHMCIIGSKDPQQLGTSWFQNCKPDRVIPVLQSCLLHWSLIFCVFIGSQIWSRKALASRPQIAIVFPLPTDTHIHSKVLSILAVVQWQWTQHGKRLFISKIWNCWCWKATKTLINALQTSCRCC